MGMPDNHTDPTAVNPVTKRDGFGRFKKGVSGNPTGVSKAIASTKTDGWQSALTGIGNSSFDKRLSHSFANSKSFTYQQLIELWRGDDLAARAIEGPPADAFRQGYEIVMGEESSNEKFQKDLEDKLEELKLDTIVERMFAMDRALGGAVLLIGADDGRDLKEPLRMERVKGVEWLTLLEPMEIRPSRYYEDPKNAKYGEPEYYELSTYQEPGDGMVPLEGRAVPSKHHLIHETRLIVLKGIQVSRYQVSNRDVARFWGDSVLTRIFDILRDFNLAFQSAGIIVTDFAQAVYHIENLMQLVIKSPEKVQERLRAIELGRSTARAVVLDTNEKFDRQSTNIGGLPDLLEQLSLRLAAAVDMPLSLLMGQAPKGLGADSEGDLRLYYDKIRSFQKRKVAPILKPIITMIMKSMRERGVPKKWDIKFNPLWQLTDAEIAEARLTQARTDSMYVKAGALFPDEIRNSRWKGGYSYETQIDESKKAPGFLSPLPPGVMPGSTPNVGGGSAPAAQGPNAHSVGGYARRNPTAKGIANTPEGGDATPSLDGLMSAYVEKRDEKWYVVMDNGELFYETKAEAAAFVKGLYYL